MTLWGRVVLEIKVFLISPRNASSVTYQKVTVFRGGDHIKSTCVVAHTMKVNKGIEVQLHAFLISAQDETSGQIHDPVALSRGKISRYTLSSELSAGQNRNECFRKETYILLILAIDPRSFESQTRSPDNISTALPWFTQLSTFKPDESIYLQFHTLI
jgi:hypothetical protein